MNEISTYIESLFRDLPKTPEILKIKGDMIQNMEEKYGALLSQGHTQEDAVQIVIDSIGDVEDLKVDLEINDFQEHNNSGRIEFQQRINAEYADFQKRFPKKIALGVALSIMSFATFPFCYSILGSRRAILVFFFFVAAAVTSFVLAGLKYSLYEKTQNICHNADLNYKKWEQYMIFRDKFALNISAALILIFFSVGSFPLFISYSLALAVLLFFFLIAISVSIFILTGAESIRKTKQLGEN